MFPIHMMCAKAGSGMLGSCRRENGGNCDIKNLTKGCKVYFPGAGLLSIL